MSWAAMRDRMHKRVVAKLKDGLAQYQSPSGGQMTCGIQVIIDRNLLQSGAEGVFRSDAVGVTWRREELAKAERGGFFLFGAERFLVEDIIADDGYMITAACMGAP